MLLTQPKKWGWRWWRQNQERLEEERIAVMEPTRELLRAKLNQEFQKAEMPECPNCQYTGIAHGKCEWCLYELVS